MGGPLGAPRPDWGANGILRQLGSVFFTTNTRRMPIGANVENAGWQLFAALVSKIVEAHFFSGSPACLI